MHIPLTAMQTRDASTKIKTTDWFHYMHIQQRKADDRQITIADQGRGHVQAVNPRGQISRRNFLSTAAALAGCGVSATSFAQQQPTQPNQAEGANFAVATVHPLASQAAIDAFKRGGNAIDAAIAASLMLSVVDGHNSGLGGGGIALIRTADGKIHALDGREKAPALATPKMFFRDGKADPELSQVGPLAAGVPGLVALLDEMRKRFAKNSWDAALEDAASTADDGFIVSDVYARRLASAAGGLKRFTSSAQAFLKADGEPYQSGDRLRQPELANTLNAIRANGSAWFYEGEFADATSKLMQQMNGLIRQQDFYDYDCVSREPVTCAYRGHTVTGFAPPSSGGIHNAQMLGMLRQFDVAAIFKESPATGYHLLLEVMKRAMSDRVHWLGDADFTAVPRGLIDNDYLASRAKTINLSKATNVASHGQPPRADVDLFGAGGHTTHLTTADSAGNVVALTQTVNTTFGSKLVVPGTGVVLNNEMDDFSIAPGVRNAFGLLGSKANLVAPGKRPLSSMSPTIVTDSSNQFLMSCGAAGGPRIITSVLQILVHCLDLQESIGAAVAAPRVHHQWSPNLAYCERRVPATIRQELESMGHSLKLSNALATAQGLRNQPVQQITAAAEPRVAGSAMAN